MGPKTKELVETLDECILLLRSCSEEHWGHWIEGCADLLRQGQITGLERFKGAFGGMSSINDLVLHPVNGHNLKESEVDKRNEQLNALLSRAKVLAGEVGKNAAFD